MKRCLRVSTPTLTCTQTTRAPDWATAHNPPTWIATAEQQQQNILTSAAFSQVSNYTINKYSQKWCSRLLMPQYTFLSSSKKGQKVVSSLPAVCGQLEFKKRYPLSSSLPSHALITFLKDFPKSTLMNKSKQGRTVFLHFIVEWFVEIWCMSPPYTNQHFRTFFNSDRSRHPKKKLHSYIERVSNFIPPIYCYVFQYISRQLNWISIYWLWGLQLQMSLCCYSKSYTSISKFLIRETLPRWARSKKATTTLTLKNFYIPHSL